VAYLMRHGTPAATRPGVYLGATNPPLSPEATAAVERAAARLAGRGVGRMVASPLLRARQTADLAAARLSLPVLEDPRLREIDFGRFEGKTWNEVAAEFPEDASRWERDPGRFVFPGGEGVEAFARRVNAFADEWSAARRDGNELIVAHGGTIRLLLCRWLGWPEKTGWSLRLDYAGWAAVAWTGGPLGELVELRPGESSGEGKG
jgi:broad specificity phosphatase PhoE